MHILALSARDAANWLAARRLSCASACSVSAARAVGAARWDVMWTTTPNPHCSALSVFLWQQSPTIWRSLIPRIPLMAFLHRPTRLILVSRVFFCFFLFTSPRSFFTWSTYLITILFHLLSIILFFFLSFFVLFPAAFCSLFSSPFLSEFSPLQYGFSFCLMQPHIWSHSHSWPAWQTLYILPCMQTHRRTQGSVIRLVSWTGQFAIHDVRAD